MALQFAFDPNMGETPENAQYLRDFADRLTAGHGRPQNIGQGLGDILSGLAAGSARRSAMDMQSRGSDSAYNAAKGLYQFTPPQLQPQNSNMPVNTGAPGQVSEAPVAPSGDGSRSWRNNNPGNIEFGDYAKSAGATGTDGRFAIFPDYQAGRSAQEKLLFDSKNYRDLPLMKALARWAPATENNVPAYVSAIGANPNMRMRDFNPQERTAILDNMQRHEGWRPGSTPQQPVQVASADPRQAFAIPQPASAPPQAPQMPAQGQVSPPMQQAASAPQTPPAPQQMAQNAPEDPNLAQMNKIGAFLMSPQSRWLPPAHVQALQSRYEAMAKQYDPMYRLQTQEAQTNLAKSNLDLKYAQDPNSRPLTDMQRAELRSKTFDANNAEHPWGIIGTDAYGQPKYGYRPAYNGQQDTQQAAPQEQPGPIRTKVNPDGTYDQASQSAALAAQPAQWQDDIKAVGEYGADFTKVVGMKGGARAAFLQSVKQVYPDWTQEKYAARQKFVNSAQGDGNFAQKKVQFNTAIAHMGDLQGYRDQIGGNTALSYLNAPLNGISKAIGSNAQAQYDDLHDAGLTEVGKALKGNGVLDAESVARQMQTINKNMPDEQHLAAVQTKTAKVLGEKIISMRNEYKDAMGKDAPDDLLTPQAMNTLKQLGINPKTFEIEVPAAKLLKQRKDSMNADQLGAYGVKPPSANDYSSGKGDFIPRVSSEADYVKMPRGTKYIAPDGTQRTKQ